MWVYAIVMSMVGLFALFSVSLPKANALRSVLLAVSCLVLILFIGLRDRIGADWDTYQTIFEGYNRAGFRDAFSTLAVEPGYAFLNYVSALVGGGIYLVNVVCAAIMVMTLTRFARLVRADAMLILFLATPYLLFTVGMGYTRQAVAIGLGCAALAHWVRGENRWFLLLTGLAVSFHYSAILLVGLVWMKSWRRILLAVPLFFIAAYVFITQIYVHYFLFYVQNTEDLHSGGVWFRLGTVLMGSILAVVQRRDWQQDPQLHRLVRSGAAVALCLIPVAVIASTLADRVCLYLFFIYLVTFARAASFSRPEMRCSVLAGIYATTYASFGAWFLVSSYAAGWWVPYHTVLLRG